MFLPFRTRVSLKRKCCIGISEKYCFVLLCCICVNDVYFDRKRYLSVDVDENRSYNDLHYATKICNPGIQYKYAKYICEKDMHYRYEYRYAIKVCDTDMRYRYAMQIRNRETQDR